MHLPLPNPSQQNAGAAPAPALGHLTPTPALRQSLEPPKPIPKHKPMGQHRATPACGPPRATNTLRIAFKKRSWEVRPVRKEANPDGVFRVPLPPVMLQQQLPPRTLFPERG